MLNAMASATPGGSAPTRRQVPTRLGDIVVLCMEQGNGALGRILILVGEPAARCP
jgi:hypothetical protein